MNILIIAPHPDDEVLGCGGTMARLSTQGNEVHVIVVTRGIPEKFPPESVEETRKEQKAAHELLGVSQIHFLDFPAPKLDVIPSCEIADGITNVIKKVRPDLLFLPHRGDIHVDHQAVFQAGIVAARPINGCSIRKIFCYETLSETEWAIPSGDMVFIPTVYVDISDFLDTKLQAMSCIKSQLKGPPSSRSLYAIEALAKYRGASVSVRAAEAFSLIREII